MSYEEDEFEDFSDDESRSLPVNTGATNTPAAASAPRKESAKFVAPVPAMDNVDEAIEKVLEGKIWRKQYDAASGKHYFYHTITKQTTWDLAKELGFGSGSPTIPTMNAPSAARSSISSSTSAGLPPDPLSGSKRYSAFVSGGGFGADEDLDEYVAFGSSASRGATPSSPSIPRRDSLQTNEVTLVLPLSARTKSVLSSKEEISKPNIPEPKAEITAALSQPSLAAELTAVFSPAVPAAESVSPKPAPVEEAVVRTLSATVPGVSKMTSETKSDVSSAFSSVGGAMERIAAESRAKVEREVKDEQKVVVPRLTPPLQLVAPTITPQPHAVAMPMPLSKANPSNEAPPEKGLLSVSVPKAQGFLSSVKIAQEAPVEPLRPVISHSAEQGTPAKATSEVLQTAEALERLVRAFVTLRRSDGASSATPMRAADVDDSDYDLLLRATRGRRRMEMDTAVPNQHRSRYLRSTPSDVPTSVPSPQAVNEDFLEQEILDTVIQMMISGEDGPRSQNAVFNTSAARSNANGSAISRPSASHLSDVITTDHYRRYVDGNTGLQNKQHSSRHHVDAFDSLSSAFVADAPNEISDSMTPTPLGNLIEENLNKYLLRHLGQSEKNTTVGEDGRLLPAISPALARGILLDLLRVMIDVAIKRFSLDGSSVLPTGSRDPILVSYDGPECQPGATSDQWYFSETCRRAIQSLPFEPLQTSDAIRGRRFRLEHWVTKPHVFSIVMALQWSLRKLERIVSDPYLPFLSRGARDDPPLMLPTGIPLFSLCKTHSTIQAAPTSTVLPEDSGLGNWPLQQQPPRSSGRKKSYFGVGDDQLEAVSYAISTVGLDVFRSIKDGHPNAEKENEVLSSAAFNGQKSEPLLMPPPLSLGAKQELAVQCVAECLEELLQDTSIIESIRRRATNKASARIEERNTAWQERHAVQQKNRQMGVDALDDAAKRRREEVVAAEKRIGILVDRMKSEISENH